MVNVASLKMLCFVFFPILLFLPVSSQLLDLEIGVVLVVVVPFALPFAFLTLIFLVGVEPVASLSWWGTAPCPLWRLSLTQCPQ